MNTVQQISLRATTREVFKKMKEHPGSVLRAYKKSLLNTRTYFRLMDGAINPIKNYPPYKVKELFNRSLLVKVKPAEWSLKEGYELIDKRKKIA